LRPPETGEAAEAIRIFRAWIGKEALRKLLANTGGVRHDVAHRLFRSTTWCANSGVPERRLVCRRWLAITGLR
jgi:hypothetical protein